MNTGWMTPKDYFERIVEPALTEYQSQPVEHRKECAVFQLASFSERYFWFHKEHQNFDRIFGVTEPKEFGSELCEERPECGLIWEAANAAKHQLPNPRASKIAKVTTATGVWDDERFKVGNRWISIHDAIGVVYKFWRDRVAQDPEPPASK